MAKQCSMHKSAGKRVLGLLAIGLIVAVVLSASIRTVRKVHSISPAPVPEPMAGMSSKRLQAHASANAILGGAAAGQREIAAHRLTEPIDPPPRGNAEQLRIVAEVNRGQAEPMVIAPDEPPGSPSDRRKNPAIRFRVRSEAPHASKEKALADALIVARLKLAEHLAQLDPPIHVMPTVEQVRTEYLRPESVTEVQPTADLKKELADRSLEPNAVFVEMDVEVSDDQVRQLRGVSRVEKTAIFAAGAFILALGLFGFLRLDAWTKGYLTTVIGVVIALAVVGAMAFLVSA